MKKFLIITVVSLSSIFTYAQLPDAYSCNFEDAQQNSEWTLSQGNHASQIPHQWVIGTAEASNSEHGMYISADNGATARYVNKASYVIAYVPLHLEAGDYDLSFDWKAVGVVDNDIDGLYVAWVPNRDMWGDSIQLNCNANNSLNKAIEACLISGIGEGDDATRLCGIYSWRTTVAKVTSDGTPHRLAFIWLNSTDDALQPGACVDNIELINRASCPAPTKIKTETSGVSLRIYWEGTSDSYEVDIYHTIADSTIHRVVTDTTVTINGLDEGMCKISVRGNCGSRHSVLAQRTAFIYFPANHCIDYLTITDSNCFIGGRDFSNTSETLKKDYPWIQGKVDFGSSEKESRHTLHNDIDEYDPNTGHQLKTVPAGEIGSIRLGNWNKGGECERAQFKYHVDAEKLPVLLLKYAVVLEEPGHDLKSFGLTSQDPRFKLDVLDADGNSIGSCSAADFTSTGLGTGNDGWNTYQRINEETGAPSGTKIVWKDWTTVGVNLEDYDGQDLTIQLTTYDCGQKGHFGYAYFTLGCASGKMDGMSCGKENTEFWAPNGFNYRWYKAADKFNYQLSKSESYIISRSRNLSVLPNDTTKYLVDLMFAGDSTCFFTLGASAMPYMPYAEGTIKHTPVDCENVYTFASTSHVVNRNLVDDVLEHTTTSADYIEWDFGDGSPISNDVNITHTYPQEGGIFTVKLTAYVESCVSDTTFNLLVPAIGTVYDTIHYTGCQVEGYNFHDSLYVESGLYQDTLVAWTGCDSVVVLDLTLLDTIFTTIDTLIMDDQTYAFPSENGQGMRTLSTKGNYVAYLKTIDYGCDSIVYLNLDVHSKLRIKMDSAFAVCGDAGQIELPFIVESGVAYEYDQTVKLNNKENSNFKVIDGALTTNAVPFDLPSNIEPNVYSITLVFKDSISGDIVKDVKLAVLYPSSVIAQRWGDVLAIKNEELAGYEFISYQWYKNGQLLPNDTLGYHYEEAGLDLTAQYQALLTRATDSVAMLTCPVVPQAFDKTNDMPSLVERNAQVSAPKDGTARWINTYGLIVSEQYVNKGDMLTAPAQQGMYLLVITEDNKTRTWRILVK